MGRDTRGIYQVKHFILTIDLDHLGYYRGNQVMGGNYRGWHYHIVSKYFTQWEIMQYLEKQLQQMGATQILNEFPTGIGVVEYKPAKYSFWKLGEKSCVLWLSGFNGKLHIEANKDNFKAKSILRKEDLVRILQKCKLPIKLEHFLDPPIGSIKTNISYSV